MTRWLHALVARAGRRTGGRRGTPRPAVLIALVGGWLLLASCAGVDPGAPQDASVRDSGSDLIIVAIAEGPSSLPAVGGSARGDYRRSSYFGSDAALAVAQDLAREQRLTELAAWTIRPLALRCMLYRLPAGADREAVLALLRRDPRVALAQPSHQFETLATPAAMTVPPAAPVPPTPPTPPTPSSPAPAGSVEPGGAPAYNDPYLPLQHGLARIGALAAQQWGQGDGVSVAVIDGAVDTRHPDLAGRIGTQRDFVRGGAGEPSSGSGAAPVPAPRDAIDRHGTAVAGVIAATANNGIGIVGVAPRATLLPLRACWPASSAAGPAARCSTFTLAQALVAAMTAGADVINLSLGGPRDPLLEQLTSYALSRGTVVVGALPASGRAEGFPSGVPGVLVAQADGGGGTPAADAIVAPGRGVFSLAPGGSYAYHDGSSMAAAHVSGAAALLRSIQPTLAASDIRRLLTTAEVPGPTVRGTAQAVSRAPMALCSAAQRVRAGTAGDATRVARAC